jgi:hypothetical protein
MEENKITPKHVVLHSIEKKPGQTITDLERSTGLISQQIIDALNNLIPHDVILNLDATMADKKIRCYPSADHQLKNN